MLGSYIYTYNSVNSSREELIDTIGMGINEHNQLNQLIKSSLYPLDFIYDADGNMTDGYLATGERFNATYDINNRLTTISFTRNNINTIESFEYFFSGMLARNKLTENDTVTKDTRYLRLGLTELQERDTTDTVIATNWWHPNAPGGVGGLLRRSENGTDYYPNYDHNGNIIQVTNQQGQVIENLFYATFGKTLSIQGQGDNPLPFGFSTKRNDFSSGLIYYGHRFYLPHLGRWLNRDPIGEQDDLNLYAMVARDPINKIDPNGEFGLVGAGIGALVDLGLQLAMNGGNFKCVSWFQVGAAGAFGAVGGGYFGGAFKHAKSGRSWLKMSKKWGAVSQRTRKAQSVPRGHQLHHWGVYRNGFMGKHIPNAIKNHPANLNSIPKGVHQRIHGLHSTLPKFNPIQRWQHGTPSWAIITI